MTTDRRGHHLVQANFARMHYPLDDPRMAGFVAALEPVNAAADKAPGFVWRLQDEAGDATSIRAFEDARILFNMSVWESVEALHAYVYGGIHLELLRQRRRWFETVVGEPHQVLWWIPLGQLPTVPEARRRLDLLRELGPTPEAFTFRERYPPPLAASHGARG